MATVHRPEFPGDFYQVLLSDHEAELLAHVVRDALERPELDWREREVLATLRVDLD